MTNASIAEYASAQVVTGSELAEESHETAACITIIDLPAAPRPALKGDPVTGKVSLMMLAGEEFGRILELEDLRIHDGRLYGRSRESVPTGSIVTIGWQDPSRTACRGVVALALPSSAGWRITVELESKLAA